MSPLERLMFFSDATCWLQRRWIVGDPTSLACDNILWILLKMRLQKNVTPEGLA